MSPTQQYEQIFRTTPTCFQQDLIETRVTDAAVWQEALTWWAANAYRAQSVGKMLDYYDQLMEAKQNGTTQHIAQSRNGKPSALDTIQSYGAIFGKYADENDAIQAADGVDDERVN